MRLQFDEAELRSLVRAVVAEVLTALDWPAGRIALTELEAAAACGVGRHVLRDLRLAGAIPTRRLGKKIVYLRDDLVTFLSSIKPRSSEDEKHRRPLAGR